MKAYGGIEVQLLSLLVLACDAFGRSVSCPSQFSPGVSACGTYWQEADWVPEPVWVQGKILVPVWNRKTIPRLSSPHSGHCTDYGVLMLL